MIDAPHSIGQQLSAARAAKQWTIEEAAKRTKLKRDAIQKMERDAFEEFPNFSSARGFVRIYARELGLNGWELMRLFPDGPDVPVEGLDLHPEDLEAIPKRAQPPIATSQSIGLFLIFIVVAVVLVLLGIRVYQIWPGAALRDSGVSSSQPSEEAPPRAESAVIEARAVPASEDAPDAVPVVPTPPRATPVALPAVPVAEPVAALPVRQVNQLRLSAAAAVPASARYARVTAFQDGQETVLFEDVLPDGRVFPDPSMPAWRAERFEVLLREAGVVEIIFNETNFGPYEKPGIQTINLPAAP